MCYHPKRRRKDYIKIVEKIMAMVLYWNYVKTSWERQQSCNKMERMNNI